ncbi:MAG TPA: ABC transporter permease [Alphaproteobacteria bacterium]|jgi:NitT/TauT family transport system permease protein
MKTRVGIQVGRAAILIGFLVLWELIVDIGKIPPFIVPAPSSVGVRLYQVVIEGTLWPHTLVTLSEILAGLAIGVAAGLLFGVTVALMPLAEDLVYPYLVGIQTLPKVAIAPLLIIWFGYGMTSKVVITALVAFFPMLVNVMAGFHSADRDQLDMMRAFGASRWRTFLNLRLPNALPMIFAGLEISVVFAVIGAVVGEFVGAQAGLGYMITVWNFNLDVAGVFTILVVLSAIGLSLHGIVKFISRRTVFWVNRDRDEKILGI